MPREQRIRRRLKKLLKASDVSSEDRGGLRRFRDGEAGRWGYCTSTGSIVQPAIFDQASHLGAETGVYHVLIYGKELLFTKEGVWVDRSQIDTSWELDTNIY